MCPGSVRILVSGYVSVGGVLGEAAPGVVNIFVPKPWGEEEMRGMLERAMAALDSPDWPGDAESERRIAPRHKVRLETRVLMIAEGGPGKFCRSRATRATSASQGWHLSSRPKTGGHSPASAGTTP